MKKVLVAHDFSDEADAALAWAARYAHATRRSVRLVHVVRQQPSPGVSTPPMHVPHPAEAEVQAAREALREARARHRFTGTAEVVVAPDVGAALVELARRQPVELIALGTRGRGAVARALLGSVAEYVVRHADCAVVTVRKGASTSRG